MLPFLFTFAENMTDDIEKFLISGGVRPTANRIMVVREIMRHARPVSLSELEAAMDTLDKSSIFRSLTLLLGHGLLHGIEDGRGIMRYEICNASDCGHDNDDDMHAHFYCEICRNVYCIPSVALPAVKLPDGFELRTVNYMLKGICPDCSRKER